MDERTLTALKGSIDKWKRIALGEINDQGSRNCPLCQEFSVGGKGCVGCPIAEETGRTLCCGSPYMDVQDEINLDEPLDSRNKYGWTFSENAKKQALAFRDWMVKLLPEGEEPL